MTWKKCDAVKLSSVNRLLMWQRKMRHFYQTGLLMALPLDLLFCSNCHVAAISHSVIPLSDTSYCAQQHYPPTVILVNCTPASFMSHFMIRQEVSSI